MTFATLKTNVRAQVFPYGVPENLSTVINNYIVEALVHLQKFVPCFQQDNVTKTDVMTGSEGSKTLTSGIEEYVRTTVLAAPAGVINRLYTIDSDSANTNSSSKFDERHYKQKTFKDITEWIRDWEGVDEIAVSTTAAASSSTTDPSNVQVGSQLEADTEERAFTGMWARYRGKLYIAPRLIDSESLVIEWTGFKKSWVDGDTVDGDDPEVQRAVRLYVVKEHARDWDHDSETYQFATAEFNDTVSEMIWECNQKEVIGKQIYPDPGRPS
jgi:hypothetical protein